MSEVAIVESVIAELRDGVRRIRTPKLDRTNSGFEPAGSPPPWAGDLYISVDEGGVQNPGNPAQDHLKERYRISVYINRRTGAIAPDRYSSIYSRFLVGLTPIERSIIAAIHGNWDIRTAANARLVENAEGEAVNEFLAPLWYTGRPKTAPRGAEWSGEEAGKNPVGWIVRELNFVGFDRVQPISSIT